MSKNLISSNKIEHRAINALEAIIDEHSTMDHQISANDKEMSWDGCIWIYQKNNGDQSKHNGASRVPVQIKGHLDPNNKYINAKRITYSVRINGEEIPDAYLSLDTNKNLLEYNTPEEPWESLDIRKLYIEINIYGEVNPE